MTKPAQCSVCHYVAFCIDLTWYRKISNFHSHGQKYFSVVCCAHLWAIFHHSEKFYISMWPCKYHLSLCIHYQFG